MSSPWDSPESSFEVSIHYSTAESASFHWKAIFCTSYLAYNFWMSPRVCTQCTCTYVNVCNPLTNELCTGFRLNYSTRCSWLSYREYLIRRHLEPNILSTVLAMCKLQTLLFPARHNSLITLKYKCQESITGAKLDDELLTRHEFTGHNRARAATGLQSSTTHAQWPVTAGAAMCGRSAW